MAQCLLFLWPIAVLVLSPAKGTRFSKSFTAVRERVPAALALGFPLPGNSWKRTAASSLRRIAKAAARDSLFEFRLANRCDCQAKQPRKSLLKYPAMPRCCRLFAFPALLVGYRPLRVCALLPQRSVTDEQRRKGEKAAQPGGRKRFGVSGCVARSSQVAADMLVARALPSSSNRFRAAWPGISIGS